LSRPSKHDVTASSKQSGGHRNITMSVYASRHNITKVAELPL
jgi:hypothetical protein